MKWRKQRQSSFKIMDIFEFHGERRDKKSRNWFIK